MVVIYVLSIASNLYLFEDLYKKTSISVVGNRWWQSYARHEFNLARVWLTKFGKTNHDRGPTTPNNSPLQFPAKKNCSNITAQQPKQIQSSLKIVYVRKSRWHYTQLCRNCAVHESTDKISFTITDKGTRLNLWGQISKTNTDLQRPFTA